MISRRQAFTVAILGLMAGPTAAVAQSSMGSSPLAMLDTDHDGTVDFFEAKRAALDLFDRLDVDHDGTISLAELHGRLGRNAFAAADPDRDATLTRDEYLAIVEQRFRAADPDGDGTVSAREFRTPAGRALARLLY
jgi:hypothetical protein